MFNAESALSYIPSAEFYNVDSDPLIARISNVAKFGIPATIVSATSGAVVAQSKTISLLNNIVGVPAVGMSVSGFELPSGLKVETIISATSLTVTEEISLPINTPLIFTPAVQDESVQNLAVLETDGVESLLDIFWETTSTGLISELNNAILDSTTSSNTILGFNPTGFNENDSTGTAISSVFELVDNFGNSIPYVNQSPSQLQLISVIDKNQQLRNSSFDFQDFNNGTYNINTADTFYFGFDQLSTTFDFLFQSTINDVVSTIAINNVVLANSPPILLSCPADFNWNNTVTGNLVELSGTNGSVSSDEAGLDLIYDLVVLGSDGASYGPTTGMSVPGNGSFTLITTPGVNKFLATINFATGVTVPNGVYNFTVTLTDAGADDGNTPCEFAMTVNNANCCAWQGFLPNIPNATDVFFNFTTCQGLITSTAYPFGLQGTTTFLCSLGLPTITYNLNGIPQTNTTAFVGPLCGPYNITQGSPPNCNPGN